MSLNYTDSVSMELTELGAWELKVTDVGHEMELDENVKHAMVIVVVLPKPSLRETPTPIYRNGSHNL